MHPPVGLIGGGHAEVCRDFVIVSMPKYPDIVFDDTGFVLAKVALQAYCRCMIVNA